jgi:hypothetical protein
MTAQGINNSQPTELGAGMPFQELQYFLTAWVTSMLTKRMSLVIINGNLRSSHLISFSN